MNEWENFVTSDGASLPLWFRGWIKDHYPANTLYLIDRAGRFHDWLEYRYPNTRDHNRKRFIKLLHRYGVEKKLVLLINFGLWTYDISPNWLRKKLKCTTY